ncbi:hypothetical protein ES703_115448 [subsurface metagenome]
MHELSYWSNHGWEDLKKEIMEGRSTYKIYIAGRKARRNVKPFYTRIGGDAVDYLLRYIRGNRKKARTSFENAKKKGFVQSNREFNPNAIFYTNDYLRTQTDLGWVAREYRRTLPFLNIMTSSKALDLYTEEDVEQEMKIARESYQEASMEELRVDNLKLQNKLDDLGVRLDDLIKGNGGSW